MCRRLTTSTGHIRNRHQNGGTYLSAKQTGSYPLISADTHLCEPLDLYDRLPKKNRARAPHLELRDGIRHLVFEGQIPFPIEAPNPLTSDDRQRYWRDEDDEEVGRVHHRAGGTNVSKRMRDQESDGVSAEIIYPNGTRYTHNALDPEFQLDLAHLFNDYYHELFGTHRDRFVVSAPLPMLDIDNAIAEVQRVAELGFRSLSIPLYVPGSPLQLGQVRAVLVSGGGDRSTAVDSRFWDYLRQSR